MHSNCSNDSPHDIGWYDLPTAARMCGMTERHFRRTVKPGDGEMRTIARGVGRPKVQVYYSCDKNLAAAHNASRRLAPVEMTAPAATDRPDAPTAADWATARLRVQAIHLYIENKLHMMEDIAAQATCSDFARRPRSETIQETERLPGNHERTTSREITLGSFGKATLRDWHSKYRSAHDSLGPTRAAEALLPKMHGRVGRKKVEIPEKVLNALYYSRVSTARGDLPKALELVRREMGDEVPRASQDTFRRRLIDLDPQDRARDLMKGVGNFRVMHNPDIEVAWDKLPYNGRWEIDDVEMDFYAWGEGPKPNLVKPKVYVISRTRTRQWVAAVVSECEITKDQVKGLVAFSMASLGGGIPDEIKFEHGTIAGDPALDAALMAIGCKVSRISMDGGHVLPCLDADRGRGHPQGKGVHEANNRRLHNLAWNEPGQTGGEERHTAPANFETMKARALKMAEAGDFSIFPLPGQWHARVHQLLEQANNTPHTGLPKILDMNISEFRHMTPDEMARKLADQEVKVLDAKCIPLLLSQSDVLPVTKNGVNLNCQSYGRFDEELQKHQTVTVYSCGAFPGQIYCQELGRMLAAYEKENPGEWNQIEKQKRNEFKYRKEFENNFERLQAEIQASGKTAILETTRMMANPAPQRRMVTVAPEAVVAMTDRMRTGAAELMERRKASAARFDSNARAEMPRRKNLDDTLEDMEGQVEAGKAMVEAE